MTTYDDRERAFEAKFALDEETAFLGRARRDRLLGLWAGEKLGHAGEALAAYAATVVRSDLDHPGDDDVVMRVVADLHGLADEAEVRAKLAEFGREAADGVQAGTAAAGGL